MAIEKLVTLDNGIPTMYHRIALLSIDVNSQNTILVYSYLSQEARQIEKDYAAGLIPPEEINFPYYDYEYINVPYDETMNVEKAYDYIKTLDKYKDAIDV